MFPPLWPCSAGWRLTLPAVIEDPLFAEVTFHHVGLVVSAVFSLISVAIAFFLIFKHATHYSKPWEQKQYIRLCRDRPLQPC